ncbi:MerR family transcriptional regulator [Neptunitalea lumnitzerae]|uniref:MerR family transcriptional regulator n=1 Tax=Neptunitalea lumnitzerae TaxID=2965509 RepID=A0ABQ5MM50_9FLAO|nr:MerR family transcriptional regulator [Neptunitalea sp. Y10]GLB50485.1 MerR family transcriptional regulator [Neptunitalea sp. Y10]
MNNIKRIFSIKDLENLSGIKAHTIRIWEKRYNLLSPERTDTNIRNYNLKSLQKLLNITLLYNNGFKISKIADFSEEKIIALAKQLVSENSIQSQAINAFKLAMVNFDQSLFLNTYTSLLNYKTFSEIFYDVFIPLLHELGLLWQTDTITPAHEHFIANLIKQKILINTEKVQLSSPTKTTQVFVLFLPENEIHEIGLLFLNYEILLRGYQSIYLGPNMPLDSLKELTSYYDAITFVSYFTVAPNNEKVEEYITQFNTVLNPNKTNKLWFLGRKTKDFENLSNTPHITPFTSMVDLVKKL